MSVVTQSETRTTGLPFQSMKATAYHCELWEACLVLQHVLGVVPLCMGLRLPSPLRFKDRPNTWSAQTAALEIVRPHEHTYAEHLTLCKINHFHSKYP
eukprot:4853503-Amphidinium_carterae.1